MTNTTSPYTIGVVTYHARFDQYFKPLIEKLVRIFPDREIVAVLNGHPDQTLQLKYLSEATKFLSRFDTVRYIAHTDHQSLSRCWNQIVILANTEDILILNDDTNVSELFRSEFEPEIGKALLTTINKSWSHFILNKEVVKKVGWFDERFLGVGHEDADYAYRMAISGISLSNIECVGVRNFVAENPNAGWQNISKTGTGNKYAEVNHEFFNRKWQTSDNSPHQSSFSYVSDFGGGKSTFSPIAGTETPVFYNLEVLKNNEAPQIKKAPTISRKRLLIQILYFRLGRRLARGLRALKRVLT